VNCVYVTTRDCTELFFHPIFYWINMTLCISSYNIIGQHRKQRHVKSWLCYSNHIKTLLSKDCQRIFTVAVADLGFLWSVSDSELFVLVVSLTQLVTWKFFFTNRNVSDDQSILTVVCVVCMQFFLHNITEPRPQDPDNPVVPVEVPYQKISLVPFTTMLRKLRYIHIRLLYVWGIVLSHEDIVSLASILC